MKARLFLFGALKLMTGNSFVDASVGVPPETLVDTGSPKTQSLLAYLALHAGQPLERRRLAFLLWPDATDRAARRNLRQYLHRLRQVLCPLNLTNLIEDVDGGRLLFAPGDALWIDAQAFEAGLAEVPRLLSECSKISPRLWSIVELYQGELLPDIYDDWVAPLRSHWRRQYLTLLQTLIQHAQTRSTAGQAIPLAECLLAADPLRESSHRLLMACYYLNGDRARAIHQYEQCQQLLHDALEVAPMPETIALYDRIRAGVHPVDLQGLDSQRKPHPIQDSLKEISLPALTQNSATDAPPEARRRANHEIGSVALAAILPPTIELNAPPFISRRSEIRRLDRALRQAEEGAGRFILIQGESGVGKTRLIQEWSGVNAARLDLFRGQCREFETMMPYHPLTEAIRQKYEEIDWTRFDPPPPWLSSVAQILPEIKQRFPKLPHALAADGATDRHYLSEGLGRFILTLAVEGAQPLGLLLDDLHWADGATWQILAYLGWRCSQAPLLIIGACQSEQLSPPARRILRSMQRRHQVTCIDLARFSPEETRQLAGFLIDNPDPDHRLLSRLYRETEGNPLFIIEMVQAWFNEARESRPGLEPPGHSSVTPLPVGVKAIIEARLDFLDETGRTLLFTAAAMGRSFSFRVLAAASDLAEAEVLEALEAWLARGLVVEGQQGYDFSHDKIRAVVYEGMCRARRYLVHRRIAQTLELDHRRDPTLSHPARLAYHYTHSDEPQRALPYLLKAADLALAVRSYQEAREFGLQAMRLLRRTPNRDDSRRRERLDLNVQLAVAYAFTGEIERALPILQEAEHAARTLNDEQRLAHIFRRSAQLLWLRGQCRVAEEYARRLLHSAEALDNAALLHAALRMLGRVGIALGAYDDAIAYLLRYVRLEDTLSPPPDLPVVYGYLAVAYVRVGAWRRAFEAGRRGVALAEAANSSSALVVASMNLAFIYAERRDWPRCLEVAQQTNPCCQEIGFSPYCFMARSLTGRALAHLGNIEEGVRFLRGALAWAEETGHRVFAYMPYLFLAEVLLLGSQPDRALHCLDRAAPLLEEADDRWAKGVLLRLRAEANTRLPAPDWVRLEADLIEATTLLRQIRARPDLARTYLTLRRLYDRAGQVAWAIDCHFRATTIFEELEMTAELREAQGYATGTSGGAKVISHLRLRGPF